MCSKLRQEQNIKTHMQKSSRQKSHVEYKDEYNIFRIKFRRLNKKIFAKNKVVCLVREKSTTVFKVTNQFLNITPDGAVNE